MHWVLYLGCLSYFVIPWSLMCQVCKSCRPEQMLISCGPSILHLQNNRDRIGTSDGQWAKTARFEPIPLRFTHMSSADAAVPLGCMAAEQLFFA